MDVGPERLKHRREFLHVARGRRKWVTPGLVLQIRSRMNDTNSDTGAVRVGLTVSRKVGGAVTRNRARRRLRAAVDAVMTQHADSGNDFVVIGRQATATRPFPALVGDLETALKKLDAWHGEEDAA